MFKGDATELVELINNYNRKNKKLFEVFDNTVYTYVHEAKGNN